MENSYLSDDKISKPPDSSLSFKSQFLLSFFDRLLHLRKLLLYYPQQRRINDPFILEIQTLVHDILHNLVNKPLSGNITNPIQIHQSLTHDPLKSTVAFRLVVDSTFRRLDNRIIIEHEI